MREDGDIPCLPEFHFFLGSPEFHKCASVSGPLGVALTVGLRELGVDAWAGPEWATENGKGRERGRPRVSFSCRILYILLL